MMPRRSNRSNQTLQGAGEVSSFPGLSMAHELELKIRLAEASIETAVSGMFWFRPDGTFFRVNQASCAMTGYSEAELLQMSVQGLTGKYSAQDWRARWQELKDKKTLSYEPRQIHKDGHLVPTEIDVSYVNFEGAEFGVGFARDLTRHKESERERDDLHSQLLHAQKMESIGVLAGGLAHDFNNLLTAIMGNIELAMARVAPGGEVHELLSAAATASVRARDLTRQLLTFASGGAPVTSAESVSDVIRETAEFALVGSNVRCEMTFESDIQYVEIDRGQVSQVIQNILVNAAHAMPTGGVIRVRGRMVNDWGPGDAAAGPGTCVRVSITDTGIGIRRDHLRRIFDPFFSTKGPSRGLGLATSYSIMRRHGGWIDVESSPGNGTAFYLYFPVSEGEPRAVGFHVERPTAASGTVLVMDDEESVRDVLGGMLTALGCEVVFARDGREAVALFETRRPHERPFDLVVLDLTVRGGMGGVAALGRLKAIDPEVRAIATSGYSDSPILANHVAHGFVGRLEKPYSAEELKELLLAVTPGARRAAD